MEVDLFCDEGSLDRETLEVYHHDLAIFKAAVEVMCLAKSQGACGATLPIYRKEYSDPESVVREKKKKAGFAPGSKKASVLITAEGSVESLTLVTSFFLLRSKKVTTADSSPHTILPRKEKRKT